MSETRKILFGEDGRQSPFETARVLVLPVPYERTVTYGRGTGAGPDAILEASSQMEVWDERSGRTFGRSGVHTLEPLDLPEDPADAMRRVAETSRRIAAAGKFVIALGGEHTVTAGVIRGAREVWGEFAVVQVDAHADLRESYHGSPWNHACAMRRVVEMGVPVHGCGIRSLSAPEAAWLAAGNGVRPIFDHERDPAGNWIARLVGSLPERVYLTVDIDGLDPALCPGTGTPEPGGLSFREAERLIEELATKRVLLGADICEVAPIPGQPVTEFVAARLVARMIAATET